MGSSEEELVQHLVNREARAMTQFYQRYRAALFAAVLSIVRNRQCAEDVLPESLVKVWCGIGSYDAAQSRLFT